MSPEDRAQNNAVATGAVFMALSMHPAVTSIDIDTSNTILVEFKFLMSPYRVTVDIEQDA